MSSRLKWRLRWRLSVLWALEWGITGAILTYLPLYFAENGLSPQQLGRLLAVSAIGLWVAPLVVGQVCDRWLASEKYLAVSHFIGGLALISIPIATDVYRETGANFNALVILVGVYAVAYFPTVPLASSLTFRHLPDPDSQFGKVRVWGTVGWVLSGLLLSVWLERVVAFEWLTTHYPATQPVVGRFQYAFSWVSPPESADCFRIAAVLSFALSSFCVFLPSTPPARDNRGKIAPLETLRMFGDRSFSLLIAISFVLAAVIPFYTLEVPRLLEHLGYPRDWVPAVMTIGQISEFPALLLLPFCLKRFGLKLTYAIGLAAWLIRYLMFAAGTIPGLVLSGIALHGVCHVFLIIVIQLYVDSKCRFDLRASAQNMFAFLTMGIAMPVGFVLGGQLGEWVRDNESGTMNYHQFFLVPALIVLLLLVVFWKWWQPRLDGESDSAAAVEKSPPASLGAHETR